jgi:hypothetical protein
MCGRLSLAGTPPTHGQRREGHIEITAALREMRAPGQPIEFCCAGSTKGRSMSRAPRPACNATLLERSSDDVRGQRDQMELQTVAHPRPSVVRCSSPARCTGRRRRPAPYVFAHHRAVRLVPVCGTHTASAPNLIAPGRGKNPWKSTIFLRTRPERFELPTFGSVDRRSIQLSYGRRAASLPLRYRAPARQLQSADTYRRD